MPCLWSNHTVSSVLTWVWMGLGLDVVEHYQALNQGGSLTWRSDLFMDTVENVLQDTPGPGGVEYESGGGEAGDQKLFILKFESTSRVSYVLASVRVRGGTGLLLLETAYSLCL